jgi:hypothetical protein
VKEETMSILRTVGLVFGLTLAGCSGAGSTEPDASESGNATGMQLLFEDHYSDTGAMLVFDSGSGLVVNVYGGIGKEDPVAMGALLASHDLAGVYLKLHPKAESAPAALVEVDRRLAEELSLAVRPSLERSGEGALTDKARSDFTGSACQNFPGTNGGTWINDDCRYLSGVYLIEQRAFMQYPGDRTYVWNDTPGTAYVDGDSWWNSVPFYMGYCPPYSWGWLSAGAHNGSGPPGGSFDPLMVGAQVGIQQAGNLGITHHYFQTKVH